MSIRRRYPRTVPAPYDYLVTSQAEWDTVLGYNDATLSGKTIAVARTGSAIVPASLSSRSPASPLTIKSFDTASRGWIRNIDIFGCNNLIIDGLEIADTVTKRQLMAIDSGCGAVTVRNCVIHGVYSDPTADWSGGFGTATAAIGNLGGGQNTGPITIENNTIYDMSSGINLYMPTGTIAINGNLIYNMYTIFIQLTDTPVHSVPGTLQINDNVMHTQFAKASDAGGPHSDFIKYSQFRSGAETVVGEILRNRIFQNSATGDGAGIAFGMDTSGFAQLTVKGNIIAIRHNDPINIARAANCVVDHNTIADVDTPAGTDWTTTIFVGSVTSSGTNVITNNVAEDIVNNVGATVTNNAVLGNEGVLISYTSCFDGPNYNPATLAELMSKLNPKAGGPLATGGVGAIGYVNWASNPGGPGSFVS
jgi:hypothetical protein